MFKKFLDWLTKTEDKGLPDKDGLYVLSWGETSGVGKRYFSFTGTYYEILDRLCYLKTKGDVFTELNIEAYDKHQLPRDGHWHTIDGKPEYHSWNECPENYNDRSKAICGGYPIDTVPKR